MESITNSEPKEKEIKLNSKDVKYATGKRKRSVARVWLKKGGGVININGKKMIDYFVKINLQTAVIRPLTLLKKENEFDVKCTVKGGGLSGQAGAIVNGLTKALIEFDPELKPALKKEKLTTRDSRIVERKKYGHKKARKSFQFSKR